MKREYEMPSIEVIEIELCEMIATSGGDIETIMQGIAD